MPTERPSPQALLLALVVGLVTVPLPVAAQSSPWYLASSLTLSREDNLLRLSEGEVAPPGFSQDDTLVSSALIGGFDRRLGLQRLQSSLSLRENRFEQNPRYNNQSYGGNASLEWTATRRVSGQLNASVSRQLSTFNADVIGLLDERNFERSDNFGGSLGLQVLTGWTLELGAQHKRVRNSLDREEVRARNFDQRDVAATLAWRPRGAIETTIGLRESRAVYPDFPTGPTGTDRDRYRNKAIFGTARWQLTSASVLEARLTSSRVRYDLGSDRNFDNSGGSLAWRWQPRAKLGVVTRLSSERGQDSYPVLRNTFFGPLRLILADQRDTRSLAVDVEWLPTARVDLKFGLQQGRRTVTRRTLLAEDAGLLAEATGQDESQFATLAARWTPTRWAQTGCEARIDTRRGDNVISGNLDSSSVACFVRFTIQ